MYDYEIVDRIYQIPLGEIHASNDFNCRNEFTVQSIQGLAETIQEIGKLLEPIVVQPMDDVPESERIEGKMWRIVAGHRRFAAIQLLGHLSITARIEKGLTAVGAGRWNLLENLERENLNILEEAIGIQQSWKGVPDKEVAKQIKRPVKWVRTRRQLLDFPEEIQQAAASGRVSQYDIEFIGQADPDRRLVVFNQILAKKAGKDVSAPRVKGKVYKQRTVKHRPKQEIASMLVHIMELSQVLNFDCSEVASTLAWVLGNITTRELLDERLPLHHDESLFDD